MGPSRWLVLALAAALAACSERQMQVNPTAGGATGAGPHAAAPAYEQLYSFSDEGGWDPQSSLTYYDDHFYGTTYLGGTHNAGTLFVMDSHGHLKILHDFASKDGDYPTMGVTELNGTLYGTTFHGGNGCHGTDCGWGTVYSISPSGENYRVLHAFTGGADGALPGAYPGAGNLIVLHGKLYGTTYAGGVGCPATAECGTVFAVAPSGKLTTVYQFKGKDDGWRPEGIVAFRGVLFGTTLFGGPAKGKHLCAYDVSCGTIFSLTTSGLKRTLHFFSSTGSEGYWPKAGLTVLDGRLYGTASRGGIDATCFYAISKGCGTVFEITTSGAFRVAYSFRGINGDGATPLAALIAFDGRLYGTLSHGPSKSRHSVGGYGTVFSVTPSGQETTLHAFQGFPNDGATPQAALTYANGALYGTTTVGGAVQRGTLFSLRP
ncbi:MAG: hypothetical protein JO324_07510 [Candidatus Eremiobacteraeota bacterium]|nr:hypothetical protein [Candidatus Eremiobacteraeota bacterium]